MFVFKAELLKGLKFFMAKKNSSDVYKNLYEADVFGFK